MVFHDDQFRSRRWHFPLHNFTLSLIWRPFLVKAETFIAANGAKLKLLDTFKLSLLRPDVHPGPYRAFHPFGDDKNKKVQNDCLHWCLPGAIDTWNELILELIKD